MKKFPSIKTVLGVLITVVVLSFLGVTAFGAELSEQALSHASPRVYEVVTVQEAVTPDLISMLDVLGTAVGQEDSGELAM